MLLSGANRAELPAVASERGAGSCQSAGDRCCAGGARSCLPAFDCSFLCPLTPHSQSKTVFQRGTWERETLTGI